METLCCILHIVSFCQRIFYFLTIFVVGHSFSWQIANIYAIQIQFEFMHRLFRQKHSYQTETEACSKNEGKDQIFLRKFLFMRIFSMHFNVFSFQVLRLSMVCT